MAILVGALVASTHGASRRLHGHPRRPAVSVDPLRGMHLYVDPASPAARQAAAWLASGSAVDAVAVRRIASQPTAYWLTGGNGSHAQGVSALIHSAAARGAVVELVLYDIPKRDCHGYSSGGASNGAAYIAWVRSIAAGIARHPAVVVVEPDAIDQAAEGCYSAADALARYALLDRAVRILKADPAARVYLDAGNAGWLRPGRVLNPLRRAGIGHADGFALNVSNFQTTAASIAYGRRVSSVLGGRHFVIDTSRNGNGPPKAPPGIDRWCNPPGRALGTPPTTVTGNPLVDAFLWIKYPGASDGSCRPGEPPAGAWWPAYALALTRGR